MAQGRSRLAFLQLSRGGHGNTEKDQSRPHETFGQTEPPEPSRANY